MACEKRLSIEEIVDPSDPNANADIRKKKFVTGVRVISVDGPGTRIFCPHSDGNHRIAAIWRTRVERPDPFSFRWIPITVDPGFASCALRARPVHHLVH